MARTLLLLAFGALLGGTATLLLRPEPAALPELGDLPPLQAASLPAEAVVTLAAREGGRDFYRQLADASASELAEMIEQASAEPASTDRELALAVLLKRYSELDALGAVRLARETRVSGAALTAVYGAWARRAPQQALAALGTVDRPSDAADIALALIAALGNDAAAVTRVGSVLADRERDQPIGGFSATLGPVPPPAFLRAAAVGALGLAAQRWAALDPRRALRVADEVDDERVRLALESAALRILTTVAPEEAFGRVAKFVSSPQQLALLGNGLIELARTDPERLLAAASGLPPEARRLVETTALRELAERDPLAALRHVEGMAPGMERQNLMQTVARSYGKRDAAAALAWARSQPGQQNLVPSIIGGIAEQDPNRAIDLALGLTSPTERISALQVVTFSGIRDDAAAEALLNRLVTLGDPALQASLATNVVSIWASRSPDRAMGWLVARGEAVPPNVYAQVGEQLARRNPRDAVGYTAQVPAAAREPFLLGVAQGYAQSDPRGAIDWLTQFTSEPWYERAAGTVAMSVAQHDGAAAARLVDNLDSARSREQMQPLVTVIANNWANQNPSAAAEWALERSTGPERGIAIRSALGVWANGDAEAARQWTFRLPPGGTRDEALTALLTATAWQESGGRLDANVLSGFASDAARQQAVLQVVQGLASTDRARAQSVADTHLTDPAVRAQAERVLDAARNAGTAPAFSIQQEAAVAPIRVR